MLGAGVKFVGAGAEFVLLVWFDGVGGAWLYRWFRDGTRRFIDFGNAFSTFSAPVFATVTGWKVDEVCLSESSLASLPQAAPSAFVYEVCAGGRGTTTRCLGTTT